MWVTVKIGFRVYKNMGSEKKIRGKKRWAVELD
jgi:hypothetical protein